MASVNFNPVQNTTVKGISNLLKNTRPNYKIPILCCGPNNMGLENVVKRFFENSLRRPCVTPVTSLTPFLLCILINQEGKGFKTGVSSSNWLTAALD
jgi:hypothetical protein